MGRPKLDLTGKIFNGIKVLREFENNEHCAGKAIRWVCECPLCHGEYLVKASRLKSGETNKCAKCAHKLAQPPHSPLKYDIGMKYGCWTIIGSTNFRNQWKVKCECGKQFAPDIVAIKHAPTSCNCFITSKGEQKIYTWLTKNNIQFEMQKTFPDCKPANRVLMFDFFLPKLNCLIEYDGQQHFSPCDYFGGIESFKKTVQYDEYKNNWAKNHNIILIRIAYYEDVEKRLNEEIVRLMKNES